MAVLPHWWPNLILLVLLFGNVSADSWLSNFFDGNATVSDDLDLLDASWAQIAPRADSTALTERGAAASISSGDTHTYIVNGSYAEAQVSLSICDVELNKSAALNFVVGGQTYGTVRGYSIQTLGSSGTNFTIQIAGPSSSTTETWSYQLGLGRSLAVLNSDTGLYWVDSDFAHALFVTQSYYNLTIILNNLDSKRRIRGLSDRAASSAGSFSSDGNKSDDDDNDDNGLSPDFDPNAMAINDFKLFVLSRGSSYNALNHSYCGLTTGSLLNEKNADLSNTTRQAVHNYAKGQVLLNGLNSSSTYYAYLAIPGNSTFGGTLFPRTQFATKASFSCQVIYNMTFCSEMAFAVPGNASLYSVPQLTEFYDTMAEARYQNFSNSLDQVACNVSTEQRYSILSTCDDCRQAYKEWLCAITIPRCADWTNNATYLKAREVGESRNPYIDSVIQPGRYKEILPCRELCYNLAQACPASLNFHCPVGKYLNESYGYMSSDGDVTCSYPDAVYDANAAFMLKYSRLLLLLPLALALLVQ